MSAIAQLKAMVGLDSNAYKAGANDVKRQSQQMQNRIRAIGTAIGISFSVAGVVMFGRALAKWSTDLSIAARNVGLLTSEMMALNKVGIQTKMGVGELQRMMQRMGQRLEEAAEGSATMTELFEGRLKLSIAELLRMNPAQQFEAVARALQSSENPLKTMNDLFGRMGFNARAALDKIAKDGLPEIDKAIGENIDRIEELGSRWAVLWDDIKSGAAGAVIDILDVGDAALEALSLIKTPNIRGDGLGNLETWVPELKGAPQKNQRELDSERRQREQMKQYEDGLKRQVEVEKERGKEQEESAAKRFRALATNVSGLEQMGASFGGLRSQPMLQKDRELVLQREQTEILKSTERRIAELNEQISDLRRQRLGL